MSAKRFRVAFSFAGEKRGFVEKVARILADRFGEDKVLYDKFHEAEFARPRLGRHLPKLYHAESDLIVVVICHDYARKEWPGLEWDAVFDLIKKHQQDIVMLCRFESATVECLYSDAGYVELDQKTPQQAAELVLERLALNEGKPKDFYLRKEPNATAPIGLVGHEERPTKKNPNDDANSKADMTKWLWIGLGLVLLSVIIFSPRKSQEELPRISMAFLQNGMRTPEEDRLELTNDFLLTDQGPFSSSNVHGVLLIPIRPGQTNASLVFSLMSTNSTLFEFGQVQIKSDFKPAVTFGEGWSPLKAPFPFTSCAVMMIEFKAFPPFHARLPELQFSPIVETNRTLISAHINAKGFKSSDLMFWVVFSTKVKTAHVVDATIRFTDADHFLLDLPNPERR